MLVQGLVLELELIGSPFVVVTRFTLEAWIRIVLVAHLLVTCAWTKGKKTAPHM